LGCEIRTVNMNAFPYIPDYMIETVLGEGGMATVYLGIQQKLQRKVAIKILDPSLLKKDFVADRFMIEAQTAANLSHPNIISIYDVGQVGKYYYIVMEYLDGSLKDLIKSSPSGKLPVKESLSIIYKIAPALDYAHSRGIIHRDIKPDNIMFRKDGTPVLVDFGIARAVDSDLHMTKTGMGIGTPHYMSPEQCQTGELDGRSDIYSLGVVLYEILTGEKPYDADTILAVALKQIQEPVPKLPESQARYQPVLDKMMAKDKEKRAQNGRELQKIIEEVLKTPAPPPPPPRVEPAPPVPPTPAAKPEPTVQPAPEVVPPAPPVEAKPTAPTITSVPITSSPPKPVQKEPVVKPINQSVETSNTETSISLDLTFDGIPADESEERLKAVESEPEDDIYQLVSEEEVIVPPVQKAERPIRKPSFKPAVEQGKIFSIPYKYAVPILAVIMLVIFIYFFLQGFMGGGSDESSTPLKTQEAKSTTVSETVTLPGREAQSETSSDQLKDAEFDRYFSLAGDYFKEKNYTEAKNAAQEARKIKTTPELEELETRIDNASKLAVKGPATTKKAVEKPTSEISPNLSDEDMYKKASAADTVQAYREYLYAYPSGHYVDKAMSKIQRLEEGLTLKDLQKEKPRRTLHLRTAYATLSHDEVESMVRRFSFFDDSYNKAGVYKGDIEKKVFNGRTVIVDQKSGLMWHPGGTSQEVQYRKIAKWIRDLNRDQYAGFSDWRLPTLEEAASLLRREKNNMGLYTDPIFSGTQKRIWTGDRFGSKDWWVARFYIGILQASPANSTHYVRPVREIKE
jgi:serine/threonine protein kinase